MPVALAKLLKNRSKRPRSGATPQPPKTNLTEKNNLKNAENLEKIKRPRKEEGSSDSDGSWSEGSAKLRSEMRAYEALVESVKSKESESDMGVEGDDDDLVEEDDEKSDGELEDDGIMPTREDPTHSTTSMRKLGEDLESDSERDQNDNGIKEESDEDVVHEDVDEPLEYIGDDEGDDFPAGFVDPLSRHFNHVISDLEASNLAQANSKFEPCNQAHVQEVYSDCHVQCSGCVVPEAKKQLKDNGVHQRAIRGWERLSNERNESFMDGSDFVNGQQASLFGMMCSYQDIFLQDRPYPTSTEDVDPILDACVLHCLNHIFRSQRIIQRNSKKKEELMEMNGNDNPDMDFRDQGFTRPKVLFLVPMRNFAFKIMDRIMKIGVDREKKGHAEGKQRIMERYAPDEQLEEAWKKTSRDKAFKPSDHKGIFHGNVSDEFKVGIQITRNSVVFFRSFFASDIVIASPLALSMMASTGGSTMDFLSSIEILVMDRVDIMAMQNWQHVLTVMKHMNRLPKEQHNADIMRVRECLLKSQGRHYRQTIMLSSFGTLEMNSLSDSMCSNHSGKIRIKPKFNGVLSGVVPVVRQLFERHDCGSMSDSADARLHYFKEKIIPRIKSMGSGILIFVPHYFDFVRVRNLLTDEDVAISTITEYSSPNQFKNARKQFLHGVNRILLYTERAHFYNRPRIRGIRDIIFYSLPDHPHYYSEIVNSLSEVPPGIQSTVTVLFSKFTAMQLERVVGISRAKKMLKGESDTYMFC